MRIQWAAVISLTIIGAAANAEEKIDVDVYLSGSLTSTKILKQDKAIVSSIFETAGVQIHWHDGKAVPHSFGIRVVEHASPSAGLDALASTRLAGAEITIFEDRVRRHLRRAHPAAANIALAYVFAHELAHAMQGVARHSETGILKAHWSGDDLTAMLFHRLTFTDSDAKLIRKGLAIQSASQPVAAAAFERK
jgi:hypothetical protein